MYFISNNLYLKVGRKGLGVFARSLLISGEIIEVSPFSNCWGEKWADTSENLRKIVFSYPQNSDSYVIGLGYTSIYNHSDDNNAIWYTGKDSIIIQTTRIIKENEEICIHYGDAYWSGGWTKL